MQADELRDTGALLGTALGEFTELARDVHRAGPPAVRRWPGNAAAPVRVLHDGIAATRVRLHAARGHARSRRRGAVLAETAAGDSRVADTPARPLRPSAH